jgi:hypothetical protein
LWRVVLGTGSTRPSKTWNRRRIADRLDGMSGPVLPPSRPPRRLSKLSISTWDRKAWGHIIAKLMQELPQSISVAEELIDKARVLDNFYIPARYPNSHPEGAPFEHYGPIQSGEAIDYASEIIEFVRLKMA